MHVVAYFPSLDLLTVQPKDKYYSADATGYYKVRFIKRLEWNIGGHSTGSAVSAFNPSLQFQRHAEIYLDKDFLKKQRKTFRIDTLWIDEK